MKRIIAVILILIIIIIILSVRLNISRKNIDFLYGRTEGMENNNIHDEKLKENNNAFEKEENNKETTEPLNILLLGLDGNGYGKDKRSDVIIIATINQSDNSLKLTSVSRDTLVYHSISNTYEKLNHAYPKGKSAAVIKTINENLDLDITHYVTFDYNSVIKAVDFFGGYPVNIDNREAKDMSTEGRKIQPGKQVLSGKDALVYMRIRQNSGGDPGRNQRQRDLIIFIMEKAKEMDKSQLLSFATKMLPSIQTSYSLLDIKDLLDLYISLRGGLETTQYTFPFEYKGGIISDGLWYAIPKNLEDNVVKFHEDILGKSFYEVPSKIEEISQGIIKKSR